LVEVARRLEVPEIVPPPAVSSFDCSGRERRKSPAGTRAIPATGYFGSQPFGANSNFAKSNPGATVQPTSVQSPSDCAACQA
jgi:hypothetical protein